MSDQNTDALNGKRPFEERVFARFDHVDSAIRDLDSRVQKLEIRAYDTKPIWEQALKEIMETKRDMAETRREMVDTKREIVETRREFSKRSDRIDAIVKENRADLRDVEDRLDKVEGKPVE